MRIFLNLSLSTRTPQDSLNMKLNIIGREENAPFWKRIISKRLLAEEVKLYHPLLTPLCHNSMQSTLRIFMWSTCLPITLKQRSVPLQRVTNEQASALNTGSCYSRKRDLRLRYPIVLMHSCIKSHLRGRCLSMFKVARSSQVLDALYACRSICTFELYCSCTASV